ncbi:ATPase, histidine kinase-, DNA gyrase B (macronuclear) [Tetrahymena thermophila SB210]|uniref:ATPase, histidine kinase-, DNA gyrase B n=1 Tax=Tetrahymena thermophila (strain SB210) TaxID=312017 RepID=Q241N3_TETTS|nr:ATPase, histidine kinase-, DNA gyrase B [Tetrahymena thermophila SB210]EAS02537.3 ATPase, histidine kinase-, DNA gyrase B [Tetrahymena thermophila SB210]|eukprot:XP_001022782.3 ATPase, histidine kinase-, DNA gyrase B [Tetrahymena thermophila SB210]
MKIFATLSHELRTPLNCSISMLEVLKDELYQEQNNQYCIEEYIVPALFSNKLLLNQINDILDFVQMDCGKFKYSFLDFNVVSLLKDCSKLVSIQAKMKKLEIILAYDQKINQIICSDPNRIRQILLNFLSNSLKFTKSGHIELGLVLFSKNIYQLYVKDSGIGITQENQKKIFNFCNKIKYQNKEEEQLNNQGCGLGLTISNSLAKGLVNDVNFKGGITVESEYGKGSKFSILVEDFNTDEKQMSEHPTNQRKSIKTSFKRIEAQIGSLNNLNYENKQSLLKNQINKQNLCQSMNSTNEINENDISQTEKQNNSIYGFVQEDHQFNHNKHTISNRENFTNNSKLEANQIVQKSKFQENVSNLSSSQVIEEPTNQDLRFDLNKIFQIQIHKNFQEDECQESKNMSHKSKHRISLKLQSRNSPFQNSSFSQCQQNADHVNSNKIEQNCSQKLPQNYIFENQIRKGNNHVQATNYQQHEDGQTNQDCSNNTDFEIKNVQSEIGSLSKNKQSQSLLQNATAQVKQFQIERKDENEQYEQEGFTSYASQIKIKASNFSNKRLTTSSLNENINKTYSFKSQISCFKTVDIENNTDINKNGKSLTPSQKLDSILEFNLSKKKKCTCPQIMVVDDNQFNLYAMQKIIQQFQFEIITFSEGDQAIQFVKSEFFKNCCTSPRIIFMDIEMPVKNGYETVQEIIQFYKSVQYNNIPIIIACTSYVGQEDCKKCIESGMSDFINKPLLKTGFQSVILNYYNIFCNQN